MRNLLDRINVRWLLLVIGTSVVAAATGFLLGLWLGR
jgi:hypothetical protein